jgi:hypothetical protein
MATMLSDLSDFKVVDRLRDIWVVWHKQYDSDEVTLLAAYDGASAEVSARCLVELIKRANPGGILEAAPAALWPLLRVK